MNEYTQDLGCGHTTAELSDYLDAGRLPADPRIDECPECRAALAALERLRTLVPTFAEHDAGNVSEPDESWIQGVLANISRDARAGRDIPIVTVSERYTLSQTEGSVRAVIRDAGDAVDGVLIGHCAFDGDVTEPGARVVVTVSVSVLVGTAIPELAGELRARIFRALSEQTSLNLQAVNLSFDDVYSESPYADPRGN